MLIFYKLFLVLFSVALIDGRGQFPYMKCRDGAAGVQCEEMDVSRGKRDRISVWPPGPFALPMSKYGCPEPGSHGWIRSHLKLFWVEPHSVFITYRSFSTEYILQQHFSLPDFRNITSDEWPMVESDIYGPYGKYSWRMNFCLKTRQNETLDSGDWPTGKYRIYSGGPECPEGFDEVMEHVTLPRNTTITSSGELPMLKIEEELNFVRLQLTMCERNDSQTEQMPDNKMNDTIFVFIKANDSCPHLSFSMETGQTLIGSRPDNDSINVDIIQSYCHYLPDRYLNHYLLEESSPRLVSGYSITTGQVETSSKYTWIQLDFGQTVSVSMIRFDPSVADRNSFIKCFYDDTKRGFLYLEAKDCLTSSATRFEDSSLFLMFGSLQARYITLVFREIEIASAVDIQNATQVYYNAIEHAGLESCNSDIGMEDGLIQDFQIRASFAQKNYLPSYARPGQAGWCAGETDPDPWILVDLITKTRLEGISFWNWEETSAHIWTSSGDGTGQSACSCSNRRYVPIEMYHGITDDGLVILEGVNLHLDEDVPTTDEQAFMFSTSVEARFVQLKVKDQLRTASACLRFELRGCKISGVQFLNCKDADDIAIYKISTEIRGTSRQEKNASSVDACAEHCLQDALCGITHFDDSGQCVLHASNSLDIWQISTPVSGHWSAKVCSKEENEILPMQIEPDGSISTNMQHVTTDSVIASIGYPFSSGYGEIYKWLVNFPAEVSVGITFTNMSLRGKDSADSACADIIYLHTDMMYDKKSKQIDYRFNGRVFYVETSVALLHITFSTCGEEMKNKIPVYFRAIVSQEKTPACMSVDTAIPWMEGRNEICDMNIRPEMFLTSMSLLNFPFINTTERWEIYAKKHTRIQLEIIEFYVRCQETYAGEDSISVFRVLDYNEENTYCNTKRPPDIIYSKTQNLTVIFYKVETTATILQKEGFRLLYKSKDQSLEHLTDFKKSTPKVTNVALGKPAVRHSGGDIFYQLRNWENAETATDGDKLPLVYGSCTVIEDYIYFHPWWAVDLNGVYNIYTVILQRSFTIEFFKPNFMIMTGMSASDMRWNNDCGAHAGRVRFSPKNTTARYVKVATIFGFTLGLCEVEVYGTLEKAIDTAKHGDLDAFIADTSLPDFSWSSTCNAILDETSVSYSEWTPWSECSVPCGTGLMTRTRQCLEDSLDCPGLLEETDVCIEPGICPGVHCINGGYRDENAKLDSQQYRAWSDCDCNLVCSGQFQKCYSIFSELTNWETAGYRCWRQNQTFVYIESNEEMAYVSYLLRDFRYTDSFTLNKDGNENDNTYFAHIGLYRELSVDGNKRNIWEDTSPVIFSAWSPGNPTTENCTKMDFRIFGADQTWHSENCYNDIAQYFVCQEPMEQEIMNSNRERHTADSTSYSGTLNRTISGQNCLRWDSPLLVDAFMPSTTTFPDGNISTAENYCRDPWGTGYLICFTAVYGRKVEWDMCIKPESESSHCKVSGWMEEGYVNETFSGKPCTNWSVADSDSFLYGEGLDEHHSYCADPTARGFLWCFTGYGNEWEPCLLSNGIQRSYPRLRRNNSIYECDDGEEIHSSQKCDGRFHCSDMSDETMCDQSDQYHQLFQSSELYTGWQHDLPDRLVPSSFYRCDNSEWVSVLSYCDGVIDCLDASDERYCLREEGTCFRDEFTCNDGGCIQISKVCDLVQDCNDGSDEYCDLRQCEPNEFACDNGQCIPVNKRCNAVPECIDKTDESNCDIDSCTAAGAFHCDFAKCIPTRLVCDKFPDCVDGSDERSCYTEPVKLCEDLWNAGQRETGHYLLDSFGNMVLCNFSAVLSHGLIHFGVIDLDLDLTFEGVVWFYTYSTDILKDQTYIESLDLFVSDIYNCTQKIRLTCPFAERKAAAVDDPEHQSVYPYCGCTVYTPSGPKRSCSDNGNMMTEPDNFTLWIGEQNSVKIGDLDFLYSAVEDDRQFEFDFGSIQCSYEYTPDNDDIACRGDIKVIPSSDRCLYDIDGSGFRTGCRSGSNIENCEEFECPNGTVKCPGSYCIPTRFVCDGSVQCPGSEDEQNCYCTNTQREVVILIEESTAGTKLQTVVENLATQFHTPGSIIRILRYSISTPLEYFFIEHRALNIRDERINPNEVIKRRLPCFYKTFASNFFKHIDFETHDVNSIIFIEESDDSSTVAKLMLSNTTHRPGVKVYRVIQDNNADVYKANVYESVTDIRVTRWEQLSSIGHRYFPEICEAASSVPCQGGYRCAASKQCLSLHQVCDGVSHCLDGDDERLCAFSCPPQCNCSGFVLRCTAQNISESDLQFISANTRSADLSQNTALSNSLIASMIHLPKLLRLNMSWNGVEIVKPNAFIAIRNLLTLDLSYNNITDLPENLFIHLSYLQKLDFDGNFQLETISATAFHGLKSLRTIRITGTKLKLIMSYSFVGLNLDSIDMSNNQINEVQDFAFSESSVENIDIDGNDISSFNKDVFTGLTSLRNLQTPAFKFCCVSPTYLDENNCYPTKDEFSSCEDLMRLPVLQTILWLVGLTSLLGNIGSITYRLVFDRERLKIGFGIFVTNLAIADFMMGIYLIIIAVADSIFRKRYIFEDEYWRNSSWCTFAGILSSVSSEASVIFVCLITIDRVLVIKYPFGQIRITPKIAVICSAVSWLVAFALAVIPVVDNSYFGNKFYSRSGVCIALPLTRDQPPGWEYSVSIFVGLNFITFILVALGQLLIFLELRKPTVVKSEASRKRDLQVTRNLILVATTDFLCWFPIGVMGIMALLSYPIPGEVYAWTVVFILPFNSALNPVLYTLTAIFGKKKFTPRPEEQQTAVNEIKQECGSSILQFLSVNRLVRISRGKQLGDSTKIQNMLEEEQIPTHSIVTAAWMLSKYLSVLHERSLIVDDLNANSVHLSLEKSKVKCVRLESKLSLALDERKLQNNIYEFGTLLRGLLIKAK